MELENNIAFIPTILPGNDKNGLTNDEISILGRMHKEKIRLSDAIFVVNVDNYVGESTRSEIEFARSLNKEIIYYTDL